MKILMIAPEPFFDTRGTPFSVYQRILALCQLGYKVELLTYPVGRNVSIPGVEIHRAFRLPFIKEVGIGPSWGKVLLDIVLFIKALQLLMDRSYDVIHSHEEAAFFSFVLSAWFSKRHLYDMHSSLPIQLKKSKAGRFWPLVFLAQFLERLVLLTCDAVITIGPDLEEIVKRVNPKVNSVMIENLALQLEVPDDRKKTESQANKHFNVDGRLPVIYTGSLESYQGLDLLLQTANVVKQKNQKAVFFIVGGTTDQVTEYRTKLKHHELEDCVCLTGNVPLGEAIAYLEMARVLVSPRMEGMSIPFKIYSYMQSGKPIVATRIKAHTSVLNDDTALLVGTTPEAFAEGILHLLNNPELGREMGLRAQKIAREKYNFTNYVEKVDQIYATLQPVTAKQDLVTRV